MGCRLGTYSSCCQWVSCKVQDGCCGCGEVVVFCVEGVRAGARGTPAARTLCGWHVGWACACVLLGVGGLFRGFRCGLVGWRGV